MKKLKSSLPAKVMAVMLFVVMLITLAASVLDIAFIDSVDGYNNDYQTVLREFRYGNADDLIDVIQYLQLGEAPEELNGRNGFYFVIRDYSNGKVIFDGLGDREYIWTTYTSYFEVSSKYSLAAHEGGVPSPGGSTYPAAPETPAPTVSPAAAASPEPTEPAATASPEPSPASGQSGSVSADGSVSSDAMTEYASDTDLRVSYQTDDEEIASGYRMLPYTMLPYTITGYYTLDSEPAGSSVKYQELLTAAYEMRYTAIAAAVFSLIFAILTFVFLLSAAGHRGENGEISMSFIDKIPFDVYTCLTMAAVACLLAAIVESTYGNTLLLQITIIAVCSIAAVLISLLWCMSLAVRIKLGTAIKSCLIYKIIAWCCRLIKKIISVIGDGMHAVPMFPRAVLIIAAVLFIEFFWIAIAGSSTGMLLFGWFIERALLVLATLYILLSMKKLLDAGHRIASGELDCKVDTGKLRGPFRDHAEDLNSITDGMNRAVAERIKSERFRTELITNVSHDIKTPLTSIINYVDLLEKEQPENEKMREYLEVLARQSAKLKKLIDDLLEASKASTGSLGVNLSECELGVLLDQTVGEYGDKLAASGLELILNKPGEPVKIMADGRHMWRIFDNLMNNICKYAQHGTRVYLDLTADELRATVTLRNISSARLNISGDELLERFVRGDASRNTEGSGLGLSIAQSLTQLQKGDMKISVDGDLFKVTLSFNRIK